MYDLSRISVASGATLRTERCQLLMGNVISVLTAMLLCVAALPLDASQSVEAPNATYSFDLGLDPETGRLTGWVEAGTEISSVISKIGELADIEAHVHPSLGRLRSAVRLDGLTIEAALRNLTQDYSTVIVDGGPGKEPTEVSKIWVIVEGGQSELGLPTTVTYSQATGSVRGGYSPDVARAASVREIVKLANKADEESISQLRDLAVSAEDPALRRAAISSLAGIAGVESFDLFVDSGLLDPDATVRIEAARSVMRVNRQDGADIVAVAAQREIDPPTREIMERLAKGETVDRNPGFSRAKRKQ